MKKTDTHYDVSVIITVSEFCQDLDQMFLQCAQKLTKIGKSFECIFIQTIDNRTLWQALKTLADTHANVSIFCLRSPFTEADAFSMGVEHARGTHILTLPVYHQIDVDDLGKVFDALCAQNDLIVCRRYPRCDAWLNQLESRVFNGIVQKLLRVHLHDLGCGVMAMTRDVAESLDVYGDLFRFIPVLALRLGYRVEEINVGHVARRKKSGIYGIGVYIRRLLDIFTLFFIVKFTKKPLRFFGLTGAMFFGVGIAINLYLLMYKFLGQALANRPLLIIGVVSMVLGIQLLSIGLVGELIIFIHARDLKEYKVEKIIE